MAKPLAPPADPRVVDTAILPPPATKDAPSTTSASVRDRSSPVHLSLVRLSRVGRRANASRRPARPPIPGSRSLRLAVALLLGVLAMLTLGGGLLLLLLWQEERQAGVASSQIDHAWDLLETLRHTESMVALGAVPLATAWAALTTLNVRRGTARRRNPVFVALSIPAAVAGVVAIGAVVVKPSVGWPTATVGVILQAIVLAVPLLAIERVARAAEGPRRPLRLAYVAMVAYLAMLQGFGALSTIVQTNDPDEWSRFAAFLIMAALVQVVGAIAINSGFGSIEDASAHRYTLRKQFVENVLILPTPQRTP